MPVSLPWRSPASGIGGADEGAQPAVAHSVTVTEPVPSSAAARRAASPPPAVTDVSAADVPTGADVPRAAVAIPETLVAYAHKARKIARMSATLIFVVFAAVAFTLRGKTESGKSFFHTEDQLAMTLLGLLAAAGVLMFTRPRLVANRDGVRVRNLLGWIEIPWEVVTAVRFDRGSPWVTLNLADDDLITVMAVQAADKDYAITTVRTLRAMLSAHRARDRGVIPHGRG